MFYFVTKRFPHLCGVWRFANAYYTKAKKELEEIRAELQAERETMTEEERQAEKQENEISWKKLMDRMKLEQQWCKKVRV